MNVYWAPRALAIVGKAYIHFCFFALKECAIDHGYLPFQPHVAM